MTEPLDGAATAMRDFVHMSPIGMVRFGDDGTIKLVNPAAVALLKLAAPDTQLVRLYDMLDGVWPALAELVASHPEPQRVVTDHRVSTRSEEWAFHLICSLVRIGPDENMLVVADATDATKAEVERAELLEVERQARERLELLERCATNLASATTVDDLARTLIDELYKALDTDVVTVNVVHGDEIRVLASDRARSAADDRGPGQLRAFEAAELEHDLPGPVASRTGETIELNRREEIAERFPIIHASISDPPLESLFAAPLRSASNSIIGALVVGSSEPDWLDHSTLNLLHSIAGQAGLTLERAKLFDEVLEGREREHEAAIRLQAALLPSTTVSHPAVEIAAAYKPASDHMMVGGDWYDTFLWPDGTLGLAVGDVAGHDVDATGIMGQLRSSMAALASVVGPSPLELLHGLDRSAVLAERRTFATAFCAAIDPESGDLVYSCAGHPPALVVDDDGPRWLSEATSPPLGIGGPRKTAKVRTSGAWILVLYSDGLIERRGESIDVGLGRLQAAVLRHSLTAGLTASSLVDHLVGDLLPGGAPDDDVVVLAALSNGHAPDAYRLRQAARRKT